jgi:hypothetical protein
MVGSASARPLILIFNPTSPIFIMIERPTSAVGFSFKIDAIIAAAPNGDAGRSSVQAQRVHVHRRARSVRHATAYR